MSPRIIQAMKQNYLIFSILPAAVPVQQSPGCYAINYDRKYDNCITIMNKINRCYYVYNLTISCHQDPDPSLSPLLSCQNLKNNDMCKDQTYVVPKP